MDKRLYRASSYLIFFFLIAAIILTFTSCPNPFKHLGNWPSEEDSDGPVFNDPSLYERNLFPDKRRTRKLGFNVVSGHYNLDDFDRDGIPNSDDPYPLDYSYPGIEITEIDLPLITSSSSNWNTFSFTSITGNTTPTVGTFGIDFSDFSNYEHFSDIDYILSNYDYSRTKTIDTNLSDKDLKVNIVSINNEFNDNSFDRDYKQGYSAPNIPPDAVAAFGRISELVSKKHYDSYFDLRELSIALYEFLTGEDTDSIYSILNYCEFGEDPYITFDSQVAKRFGLPYYYDYQNPKKWDSFSYDTVIFSTLKVDGSLLNDSLRELRNNIFYSPYFSDYHPDEEYQIAFDNYKLDLDKTVAVKVLIEKNESGFLDDKFKIRIFVSGEYPMMINDHSGYIEFLSLRQSGFSVESNRLIYSLTDDEGRFRNFIFKLLKDNENKADLEHYVLFLFFIPSKNDNTKWAFAGSNVHFWPLKDRTTVVAKVDENNDILEGPYVLPYEYLVDPDRFIGDTYLNGTYKPLYVSVDGLNNFDYLDIFHINAESGEKLLFMQGVQGVYPERPCIDTENVYLYPEGDEPPKYQINCTEITELPDTIEKNRVVNSFIDDLKSSAYIIDFDNIWLIQNNHTQLQLPQRNYYSGLVNNVLLRITGYDVDELFCDINFGEGEHWVPNTGETLADLGIKIWGKAQSGKEGTFESPIKIVSPLDPNWVTVDPDGSNVHRNKGSGITLCAVNQSTEYRLAEFTPAPVPTEQEPYTVTYNPAYFDTEGIAINGYSLKTDQDGNLHFARQGGFSTTNFAIKSIGGLQEARPGDDFRLRFKLVGKDSLDPAIAPDGDFIAIYDKLLLDRANQYIDETVNEDGTPSGNADWNGSNQIPILPWTRFSDNSAVYGSMAYSWGATDTVEYFNLDLNGHYNQHTLNNQLETIRAYYTNIDPQPAWQDWDSTIAPGDNWFNYVAGIQLTATIYDPRVIDGATYYPYKPGFSAWMDVNGNYEWNTVKYSAGIDCSGLVHQAVSYPGENYALDPYPDTRQDWNNWVGDHLHSNRFDDADITWAIDYTDRHYIVPGDILYMDGHVAIVERVDFNDQTRTVVEENVYLIEAAWGNNRWKTAKERRWSNLIEEPNLQVRRLIIN